MYTWEIQKFFEEKNYELDDYKDFYDIYMTSPQVRLVKYEGSIGNKSKYYFQTYDGYDGWVWIKKKGSD